MFILGINAYHGDSSACLVKDGKLIAAAEEERFRRIKHWAGFPSESIRYCLKEAGITLESVDHIAINSAPYANIWRKAWFALTHRPDMRLVINRLLNRRRKLTINETLLEVFPDNRFCGGVYYVEHHLAHLASAFLVSPFEDAVTVSIDGFGDFASAAWGIGSKTQIDITGRIYFPHSLGIFYQAMTQYLGFPYYGDEYKVMGLAPYGEPRFLDDIQKVVILQKDGTYRLNLRYFRHHIENVEYRWDEGAPVVGCLYTPALEKLLGPARKEEEPLTQKHKDIARSVQAMYEEAFFHLLNMLYEKYKIETLTLAGGCAMNSVANGKIYKNTSFRHIYIQSAAGDAGGAIGAAFTVWNQKSRHSRSFIMNHAYYGPEFPLTGISALLDKKRQDLRNSGCVLEDITDESELCQRTAEYIAQGKVVGWFQGRMEWGPRALGNRSILCDPRRADMKDILNQKIKRRESFRPFAPSILRETVPDWFETEDDVPFMMAVFQIREEKRSLIPAVTHVDGSGRLQTVHKNTNPRYYRIIKAFEDLTGIPIVLNTSFNENEPVVCRPEEALDCFLRTKMDVLVMGNYMITRTDS